MTELGHLLLQFVGLVPDDEYQILIPSSTVCMCFGYGGGSAALYATVDD
jgi:hypothetical protein